jgi:hypothetical protein
MNNRLNNSFSCVSILAQPVLPDPDPGSGAFLTPGSEIRDGLKSGSGIRIVRCAKSFGTHLIRYGRKMNGPGPRISPIIQEVAY